MAKRGKKDCPNCNTEVGARSHLCESCGWYFPEGAVRQDLLKESQKPTEAKIYTSVSRGRKKCPECGVIIGGVTKICPKCEFDFSTIIKEKVEKKEKKEKKTEKWTDPRVLELVGMPKYTAPDQLSPTDHAQRILDYGKDRAKMLLDHAKMNHCWKHIDWAMVEKGL